MPPGVFNVVQGIGEEVGAALVGDPRLKRISFTGSPETAKHIGRSAAENIAEAGSVDAAFKAWLGSPPHQASILNGNLTAMGAAAANTDGDVPGRYWCVIFIQEVAPGQFTTAGLVHTMPLGVKGEGCHD